MINDFRVPSLIRSTRYRRDQRQLDEEEEMWFEDEEEFEGGGDQIVAASDDLIMKKFDNELEPLSKLNSSPRNVCVTEGNGLKCNALSPSSKTILNHAPNLTTSQTAVLNETNKKSSGTTMFLKKVCFLSILSFALNNSKTFNGYLNRYQNIS